MDTIPENLKKQVLRVSILIFLILTFGIGPTNLFGLAPMIQKQTDYYFSVTIFFLDYGLLAFIPFFALRLSSKHTEFRYADFLLDILVLLFWTTISFVLGMCLLIFVGKPSNRFVPEYLLSEPIFLYSVCFIGLGIRMPFLLKKST